MLLSVERFYGVFKGLHGNLKAVVLGLRVAVRVWGLLQGFFLRLVGFGV